MRISNRDSAGESFTIGSIKVSHFPDNKKFNDLMPTETKKHELVKCVIKILELCEKKTVQARDWRMIWNDSILKCALFFTAPEIQERSNWNELLTQKQLEKPQLPYRVLSFVPKLLKLIAKKPTPANTNPESPSGERQFAKTLAAVKPDHLARYGFIGNWIRGNVQSPLILDAACGCGYGSFFLKDYAHHVTGVDRSQEAITWASLYFNSDNIDYRVADLEHVDWARISAPVPFDIVVSLETLEHFENPATYLKRLYKATNSPCKLIISTPNPEVCPLYTKGQKNFPFHFKHWSIPELDELLYNCGYRLQTWFGQVRNVFYEQNRRSESRHLIVIAEK